MLFQHPTTTILRRRVSTNASHLSVRVSPLIKCIHHSSQHQKMSYLGNYSFSLMRTSDKDQDFLELLDTMFPPRPGNASKRLFIFDGTANQKVPILMWMGDQVINLIREAYTKTRNDRKRFAIYLLEQDFQMIFTQIKVSAHYITESTSTSSENRRKEVIENYARVIDTYREEVEKLAMTPAPPQSSFQSSGVGRFNRTHVFERQAVIAPQQNHYEIFRAAVPMTRILGAPYSVYVSTKAKGISIHEVAYADQNRHMRKIPYRIDLNETYQEDLNGVPKNLTYVGVKYPDGTSLSYLPIKDITLLREQSFVQHPTQQEGGVVELMMPKFVYDKIKKLCSDAYLARYPDHIIRYPIEYLVDSGTIKLHALARGYRRLRIINGKRTFHVTLLEALEECTHDMKGDGLLHLRFDRTNNEDRRATMKLIFFGLQMVRNPSNHFQKIFRL